MGYRHHSDYKCPRNMSGNGAGPRIAVVVVTYNTERNSLRGVRRYHGLIHTNKSSKAVRNVQPRIGMISATMPQAVYGEGYMILLTYGKEVAMIVSDE